MNIEKAGQTRAVLHLFIEILFKNLHLMKLKLFFPILVITLLSWSLAYATKSYTVTIKLQEKIHFDQFKIYVDDGISQKLIEIKDAQSLKITIKGNYYSQ